MRETRLANITARPHRQTCHQSYLTDAASFFFFFVNSLFVCWSHYLHFQQSVSCVQHLSGVSLTVMHNSSTNRPH